MSWVPTDVELRHVEREITRLQRRRDELIVTMRDIGGATWTQLAIAMFPDEPNPQRLKTTARDRYHAAVKRLEAREGNEETMSGKHHVEVTRVSRETGSGGETHTSLTIDKGVDGVDVRTMTTSPDGNRTVLNDSTMFTGPDRHQQAAVEHGRRASGAR